MKNTGIQHFNIELIKEIQVATSNLAKIQEQVELWAIPIEKRLNSNRAHIPNIYYRGNIEGKRKNRKDYYYRQKKKPEWVEKERQRNKIRMRIKRQLIKNNLTKNKKRLVIVDKFSKI
jgi:DNA replication protein DnaC